MTFGGGCGGVGERNSSARASSWIGAAERAAKA